MKILFNCLTLEKGGAERVITTLANELSDENDITIVTLKKTNIKYILRDKIKIFSVDRGNTVNSTKIQKILSKVSINNFFRLKKIIIKESPDIIVSFLPEPSLKLMLLKKINKKISSIPTIISIRNDPNVEYKNQVIFNLMKYLYKNVDKLVLQTKEAEEYFKKINFSKEKLTIIPNPISDTFLKFSKKVTDRKKEIVNIGRLYPQKNQKLLIEAFQNVLNKYPEYILKIYGEGILRNELEDYIKAKDLNEKVKLLGQVDNIENEIYNASMFVLSSDYEGMPNSLMEALALGIPCISTDCPCGGPKFLIENNINGLLVPVKNKEKLENAICKLIENEKMGREFSFNSKKICNKFSIQNIAEQWKKEIEKIIERKKNENSK